MNSFRGEDGTLNEWAIGDKPHNMVIAPNLHFDVSFKDYSRLPFLFSIGRLFGMRLLPFGGGGLRSADVVV